MVFGKEKDTGGAVLPNSLRGSGLPGLGPEAAFDGGSGTGVEKSKIIAKSPLKSSLES